MPPTKTPRPEAAAREAALKRLPSLKGVKPTKREREGRLVYTFTGPARPGPGGVAVPQVVVVTVSREGKVLKVLMRR